MPISRGVFDDPEHALEQLILDVLRVGADGACTLEEIVAELHRDGFPVEEVEVGVALTVLVEAGRAESKVVFNRAYSSYTRRIGFRP